MSTIQKAFIFIVVVLAVLTAAVTLVLFAQRTNWKVEYDKQTGALKDTQKQLDTTKKDLAAANDAHAAKVAELESKIGSLTTQLTTATNDLDSVRADKAHMETVANDLTASFNILTKKMDVLAQRTAELQTAKEAAEKTLEEVKAAATSAREQLAISERRARDLAVQVDDLTKEAASREDRMKVLQQKIDILASFAPPVGPSIAPATKQPVFGKITGLSKDGSTAFLSVGSDDGVVKDMLLLIYKSDGTYVAKAKVYDVAADKAAARIVKPAVGTIAEGDNVTNE